MQVNEIADRIEIAEISQRYADAIDTMRFERLDKIFAAGAHLAYDLEGNSFVNTYPEAIGAAFRPALERCEWTCHLISEPLIDLRGETAHMVARVIATHIQVRDDGSRNTFVATGMYTDELIKSSAGWRIHARHANFPCVQGLFLADGVKLFDAPSRADN